jgi:hypothetical protein
MVQARKQLLVRRPAVTIGRVQLRRLQARKRAVIHGEVSVVHVERGKQCLQARSTHITRSSRQQPARRRVRIEQRPRVRTK